MKQNFLAELLFVVVLILFSIYRYFYNVETVVLKVFSPTVAAVDFNGDRHISSDEIVCVSGIKTFSDNLADFNEDLSKKLKISEKDALSMAYMTEDYSSFLLSNKVVKFKADSSQENPDCVTGDIFVNNKSYRGKLLEAGYAYSDDEGFDDAKLAERIESVKNLHPVIMNRKSKKFHEIGCKFGKAAQDYSVLLKEDLPENAIPCKWCHRESEKVIPAQKVYPDRISDGSVKMFLTDMTTHLNVKNDCSSNICQALLTEINNAQETIDIAAYGWVSVPQIDEALKNAVARGVKFRMVYDFTARNAYYPDTMKIARFALESKSDLVPGNSRLSEYLMHNKFMVFDRKKVVAGSLNYSKTDFSEFNSNVVIFVESPEIAQVYTQEFEQMLSGKFHTQKQKREQYQNYKVGDTDLQVYFSPQDNVITDKVLGYVENAKKYIYMPVFVITHKPLEAALLRAKARGVDIKLIVDATNVYAAKSSVKALREGGVPVKVENYAGKLHSKAMIIDDEYILVGSMNFSRSGEAKNDENLMIIKNPRLAVFYKDFFRYLWAKIPDIYLTRAPRAESLESIGSCFDGIDNDFDGKIDKMDEGCVIRSK